MRVRKPVRRLREQGAIRLAALGAAVAAILLCVGTASAQSCLNTVAPGETFYFTQASSGGATSLSQSLSKAQGGSYNISENQVQAVALTYSSYFGGAAEGYGQLAYVFCIPGNVSAKNDPVTATISANVSWTGLLAEVSIGSRTPSVTGTLALVDLGSNGSKYDVIGSASPPPLNQDLSTIGISISAGSVGANINFGYTPISGSAESSIQATVLVGHFYAIEYKLDCQAPQTPALALGAQGMGCYFTSTLPISNVLGIPAGNYHSRVDLLSVSLTKDLYAEISSVNAEVNAVSKVVSANRRAIASANLTAEQENAQLLGILKQIESLLSAPQVTPAAPSASNPAPPKHRVNPAKLRIFRGEFQSCVQRRNPQAVQQCLKQLGTSEQSGPKRTTKAPAH